MVALMYPPYRYEAKELHDAMKVTRGHECPRGLGGERRLLLSRDSLALGARSPPEPPLGMVTWTVAEPSRLPHAAPAATKHRTDRPLLSHGHAEAKTPVSEDVTEPGVQELGTSLCFTPVLQCPLLPTTPFACADDEGKPGVLTRGCGQSRRPRQSSLSC